MHVRRGGSERMDSNTFARNEQRYQSPGLCPRTNAEVRFLPLVLVRTGIGRTTEVSMNVVLEIYITHLRIVSVARDRLIVSHRVES